MTEIQAPTHCPSCNSSLEWSNHLLYCRNSDCDSQSAKKLKHFAKTLKIKGLGPASINKLGLTSLEEIYALDLDTLCEKLSSDKLGQKLFGLRMISIVFMMVTYRLLLSSRQYLSLQLPKA